MKDHCKEEPAIQLTGAQMLAIENLFLLCVSVYLCIVCLCSKYVFYTNRNVAHTF